MPTTVPYLYSSLASDPDLAEIVEMFVEEMPDRMKVLVEAYEANNLELLGRTAHQIKGSAGSYGFRDITPAAGKLENAVRGNEGEEAIRRSLADLVELCSRVRAGIPE